MAGGNCEDNPFSPAASLTVKSEWKVIVSVTKLKAQLTPLRDD